MILRIPIGGFPLSQDTAAALESLRDDRMLFRCTFDIQMGGIDTAASYLADRRTPDLLIVEVPAGKDQLFSHLESLANVCDPETRLILIGADNDIELYRTLIQQGISDYLVSPIDTTQLRDSIAKVYLGQTSDAFDGRVIGMLGAAGGVGSSVIAHNVAFELSEVFEDKVAVVDLDFHYGTAALNFNMQPRQTIADALTQVSRIDGDLLDQFFMPYGEKLSLLASPASLSTGLQITQESFDALMRAVKPMSAFTVLDLPHIWSPWIGDALAYVDDLVVVARPDLTNLRNAKNIIEYLGPKRGPDAPTRIVLNQVGAAKRADLTTTDFRDAVAIEPALSIPYDPEAFGRALNNGEMMSKAAAKSKATTAIGELASLVSDRVVEETAGKKSVFSLFKKAKK